MADFPPPVPKPGPVRRIFTASFLLAQLAVLILMFTSFPVGAYTVFNTRLGAEKIDASLPGVPFFVAGLPLVIPVSASLGDAFLILWLLSLAIWVTAFAGRPASTIEAARRVLSYGTKFSLENPLLAVTRTYTALLVAISALKLLQESAGIPSGSLPETDPLLMFVSLSLASFVEEFGFRVSIVGLVALLWTLPYHNRPTVLKVLWHPAKYVRSFAGDLGYQAVSRRLWTSVVVSASFFGLAHVLYGGGGDGWQLGKVSLSALAGLALGWAYVRYGFPSAVLLHWCFNYFLPAFYYFDSSNGAPGLASLVFGENLSIVHIAGVLALVAIALEFRGRLTKPSPASDL